MLDIKVVELKTNEDESFSVVVEFEGFMYYMRNVQEAEGGMISYELGVAYDTGSGAQIIEVTENHEEIADLILQQVAEGA